MDPWIMPRKLSQVCSAWTQVFTQLFHFNHTPPLTLDSSEFEKADEIYFRLGIIYKQQQKYPESLEVCLIPALLHLNVFSLMPLLQCFDRILRSPPNPLANVDIWFQIGHVYEQQKDVSPFPCYFSHDTYRVISLSPSLQYNNAKDAYERVLADSPNHAKVLQQLGWLYHQSGSSFANQDLAIQYLTRSLESGPFISRVYIFSLLTNHLHSNSCLQIIDGSDAQSWYLLGRAYMAGTKYQKAYEAYQQAVYRDGRNPTFWCSIGVLYYNINQYRDALDAYSRAIRINPYISEVWFDLGSLYESCNNQIADAIDAYARAADLDSSNPLIKQRLTLLREAQRTGAALPAAPGPQDVHPTAYATVGPPTILTGGILSQSSPHNPGSRPSHLPGNMDFRGGPGHDNVLALNGRDLPMPAGNGSRMDIDDPSFRHIEGSTEPFRGGPPPPLNLEDKVGIQPTPGRPPNSQRSSSSQHGPGLAPLDLDNRPYPSSSNPSGPIPPVRPGSTNNANLPLHHPQPQPQMSIGQMQQQHNGNSGSSHLPSVAVAGPPGPGAHHHHHHHHHSQTLAPMNLSRSISRGRRSDSRERSPPLPGPPGRSGPGGHPGVGGPGSRDRDRVDRSPQHPQLQQSQAQRGGPQFSSQLPPPPSTLVNPPPTYFPQYPNSNGSSTPSERDRDRDRERGERERDREQRDRERERERDREREREREREQLLREQQQRERNEPIVPWDRRADRRRDASPHVPPSSQAVGGPGGHRHSGGPVPLSNAPLSPYYQHGYDTRRPPSPSHARDLPERYRTPPYGSHQQQHPPQQQRYDPRAGSPPYPHGEDHRHHPSQHHAQQQQQYHQQQQQQHQHQQPQQQLPPPQSQSSRRYDPRFDNSADPQPQQLPPQPQQQQVPRRRGESWSEKERERAIISPQQQQQQQQQAEQHYPDRNFNASSPDPPTGAGAGGSRRRVDILSGNSGPSGPDPRYRRESESPGPTPRSTAAAAAAPPSMPPAPQQPQSQSDVPKEKKRRGGVKEKEEKPAKEKRERKSTTKKAKEQAAAAAASASNTTSTPTNAPAAAIGPSSREESSVYPDSRRLRPSVASASPTRAATAAAAVAKKDSVESVSRRSLNDSNSPPSLPRREVDEDYDDGVAETLIGLASSRPAASLSASPEVERSMSIANRGNTIGSLLHSNPVPPTEQGSSFSSLYRSPELVSTNSTSSNSSAARHSPSMTVSTPKRGRPSSPTEAQQPNTNKRLRIEILNAPTKPTSISIANPSSSATGILGPTPVPVSVTMAGSGSGSVSGGSGGRGPSLSSSASPPPQSAHRLTPIPMASRPIRSDSRMRSRSQTPPSASVAPMLSPIEHAKPKPLSPRQRATSSASTKSPPLEHVSSPRNGAGSDHQRFNSANGSNSNRGNSSPNPPLPSIATLSPLPPSPKTLPSELGDGGEETPRGERARSEAASDMLIDSDQSRSSTPPREQDGDRDDEDVDEDDENMHGEPVSFRGTRTSPPTSTTAGKATSPTREGASSAISVDPSTPKNSSDAMATV